MFTRITFTKNPGKYAIPFSCDIENELKSQKLVCCCCSVPQLNTLRVIQYEHQHPYICTSTVHRVRLTGLPVRPFSLARHIGSHTLSSEEQKLV